MQPSEAKRLIYGYALSFVEAESEIAEVPYYLLANPKRITYIFIKGIAKYNMVPLPLRKGEKMAKPVSFIKGPSNRLSAIMGIILCSTILSAFAQDPFIWSKGMANSFMKNNPSISNIQGVYWDWRNGYMMFVFEKLWRATGDIKYYNYVKSFCDQLSANSRPNGFSGDALDHFLPGHGVIMAYNETKDPKYKTTVQTVRNAFTNYRRTSDSGFWHAYGSWAGPQMWVDGTFMGQMFLVRYGAEIGDSAYAFKEVVKQTTLMAKHCQKPNGLLLHAWDDTKSASWANRQTGLSSEVWSEGLGWYSVFCADVFLYLPQDFPGRDSIVAITKRICAGLKATQDTASGLWYVVVDKGDQPGNWTETGGSGQFMYLIKRSIENGFISEAEYLPVLQKAYVGIQKKVSKDNNGNYSVRDGSSVSVLNNYGAYLGSRESNATSTIGSFILGTMIMEKPTTTGIAMAPISPSVTANGLLIRYCAPGVVTAVLPETGRYDMSMSGLDGKVFRLTSNQPVREFTFSTNTFAPGMYLFSARNAKEMRSAKLIVSNKSAR